MWHIFHSVEVRLSLLDRLKALFGKTINIEVKMLTDNEDVSVLSTKTDVRVGNPKSVLSSKIQHIQSDRTLTDKQVDTINRVVEFFYKKR